MLGEWDVGRPKPPRVSGHSLTSSSSCGLLVLPLGGGGSWRFSGDWVPTPQETQNPGPAGWRVGAGTKRASVQPGWAAHRILGEAARAGFRPVLLPAEAAGMPGALAQRGLSSPPATPSLISSWSLGYPEPESHPQDPRGS